MRVRKHRKSWAPAAALASALGCGAATGPDSEPLSVPVEDTKSPSPRGNAAAIVELTKVAPRPDEPEPAPTCQSEVGDPVLLFQGVLLARPPKGVEFLPDDGNPTLAQALTTGGFVSTCDGTVKRMLVLAFANDAAKSLDAYITDFVAQLGSQGYTGGTRRAPRSPGTVEHAVYDFPSSGGMPASTLHLSAGRHAGTAAGGVKVDNVFITVFETTPDDYEALASSFVTSGNSLLLVPP